MTALEKNVVGSALMVVAAGCARPPFACDPDAGPKACELGGEVGTCRTARSGQRYCAMPWGACASGLIWDATAGDGVAGTCVDAGPSCAGLALNCGPARNEGCCENDLVYGGTFLRSHGGDSHTSQKNPATVGNFVLDRYEITVGRFRNFVNSGFGIEETAPTPGAGPHPQPFRSESGESGWAGVWTMQLRDSTADLDNALRSCASNTWAGDNDALPINCITWYEAVAFCSWDGGWLPTEAEWNYAAAGGGEQREYPWGAGIDDDKAVYNCNGDPAPGCLGKLGDILPVGSKPAGKSRWGPLDLAGNVSEWVFDGVDYMDLPDEELTKDYRCNAGGTPPRNQCDNCDCSPGTNPTYRVRRGGDFKSTEEHLRTAYRLRTRPGERYELLGTRCARRP